MARRNPESPERFFDLKAPCANCPFRKGQGRLYGIHPARLESIKTGTGFSCHKTVYAPGDVHETQCAGLMAVLHRENRPHQMMRLAERMGYLDPGALDPRGEAHDSWQDVLDDHARETSCARPRGVA